ncbi:MAG: phosphatidylserine decarboxylase [Cyanothece sp. SIO2G6]|nr:phosphatidylserine decarboxylase [Cyanothece sp. SIO2G6]
MAAFIEQIQGWYSTDYRGFRTYFDAAVENVKPRPEETDDDVWKDWSGAGIDELCAFFEEWYAWLPDVPTGLDYIQKFSWLYYLNEYGLAFVTKGAGYEMTKNFVAIRGTYFDSPESAALVNDWVEQLGGIAKVSQQYVIPEPTNPTGNYGFNSFNEFFIREVQPGVRPITSPDDDSIVVASADCVINMIVDDLTLETQIPVKTVYLNVRQLLDNSEFASNFEGGTAVSCILMPDSYHRYHAPVSGQVVDSNENVAGEYFGIQDFPGLLNDDNVGYGYNYSVFEDFRRGYMVIQTERFGCVAVVPVGLNTIASVVFKDEFKRVTSASPVPIIKGDEIGYFQYGGSLNILLFEADRFPSLNIFQGQQIGLLLNPDEAAVKLTKSRRNRFLNRVAYLAK